MFERLICFIVGHKRRAKTIEYYTMENGIKKPHGTAMCPRCNKDPLYCSDRCSGEVEFPPDTPIKGTDVY